MALVVALAAQPAPLPHATPAAVGLSEEHLAQATVLLRRMVMDRKIAGAVAGVALRGRIAYLEAVGLQDLATRARMEARTLFRIYSMSKPVTAVAVMMLVEEGKASLDDPVSKFLPKFDRVRVQPDATRPARRPSRPVAVRGLLLHTFGLSRRTPELYRRLGVRSRADTLPAFVTKIAGAPLMEDPGTAAPAAGEHSGDGTAGTIFWVDPRRKLVTVLMTQSQPANPDGIRQKFKAIVDGAVVQ